jgi:hypothetical protein
MQEALEDSQMTVIVGKCCLAVEGFEVLSGDSFVPLDYAWTEKDYERTWCEWDGWVYGIRPDSAPVRCRKL